MATHVLELDGINHSFNKESVLRGISLSVEPGQIVCLLGPSGCGKTTLLRIIAGLLEQTLGRVFIEGLNQASIPTHRRNIGFVFQDAALFPHLDVYNNVAFPFVHGGRRLPNNENWRHAVARIIYITGLQAHNRRSISNLSGGQLQRVALARALVYRPPLLLLDEPLSSLDNVLKAQLLDLLLKLHTEYGTSFLYVTHDEREALRIGTHIAVIDSNHVLKQYGTVDSVVSAPESEEVARIVGGWNIIQVTVAEGEIYVVSDDEAIKTQLYGINIPNASIVKVGIPIRAISIVLSEPKVSLSLPVVVTRSMPWYEGWLYECKLKNGSKPSTQTIVCLGDSSVRFGVGESAFATFREEDVHAFKTP
jgi:ABC-type Fe3+/spermidine/putrescine transport system ATPase subunit